MLKSLRQMTAEEYLAFDEASEMRHEFIDGDLIPMSGGSRKHSSIIAYTIAALINLLADSNCEVHTNDMRVRVAGSRYVYPDVSVVCGEARFADEREVVLLNPTVVVEVTSPSSYSYDHVDKLAFYSALPSVQGYLILDQERVFADWYRRDQGGWNLKQFSSAADEIALEPLGCRLPLTQVYRGVNFARG